MSLPQLSQSNSYNCSGASGQDLASSSSTSIADIYTSPAIEEASYYQAGDWSAHGKPRPPYKEGFIINAFRHKPSGPFGLGYDTEPPSAQDNWEELSQIDYCLSRSPIIGKTDSSIAASLIVTSVLRTGLHRGAQIVVVNHAMVAKIYDPLYYPFMNDYGTKNDVVQDADGDYGREVAALEQLQYFPQAKTVTPAYYGSWTMMIETKVKQPQGEAETILRPVRFILEDFINGDCMADVDASELRDEVRSLILKESIVAETLVLDAMVEHRDMSPRNIMIESSNYKDPSIPIGDILLKIKLLDFNVSVVIAHPKYLGEREVREKDWSTKLQSPIVRYFGDMMEFSARGWCSNAVMDAELWLWQHFHEDERYAPVSWDPSNPRERPVYREPPTLAANSSSMNGGITEACDCSSNSSSFKGSETSTFEDGSESSEAESIDSGSATILAGGHDRERASCDKCAI